MTVTIGGLDILDVFTLLRNFTDALFSLTSVFTRIEENTPRKGCLLLLVLKRRRGLSHFD